MAGLAPRLERVSFCAWSSCGWISRHAKIQGGGCMPMSVPIRGCIWSKFTGTNGLLVLGREASNVYGPGEKFARKKFMAQSQPPLLIHTYPTPPIFHFAQCMAIIWPLFLPPCRPDRKQRNHGKSIHQMMLRVGQLKTSLEAELIWSFDLPEWPPFSWSTHY